jgi:hypothetical protein
LTSAAEAAAEKQSGYRSVEALRHPKSGTKQLFRKS